MVPKICSVDDCDRALLAKSLCQLHYTRLRNTGTTDARKRPTELERFWSKVEKTSTCWIWHGARMKTYGHALFKPDGQNNVGAYRYSYELHRGPIAEDLVVDHLCRVPWCVNPDHLELVSSGTNVLRGIGPGAINKRKTHCIRGHEFAGDNLRITPQGGRICRECERAKIRKQRAEGKRRGIRYIRNP